MNELYTERAQLIAALSKHYPAHLELDPQVPSYVCVIVELPTGQVSWHVANEDLVFFGHLLRRIKRNYDGHTTAEKYQRLNALPDSGDGVAEVWLDEGSPVLVAVSARCSAETWAQLEADLVVNPPPDHLPRGMVVVPLSWDNPEEGAPLTPALNWDNAAGGRP